MLCRIKCHWALPPLAYSRLLTKLLLQLIKTKTREQIIHCITGQRYMAKHREAFWLLSNRRSDVWHLRATSTHKVTPQICFSAKPENTSKKPPEIPSKPCSIHI